MCILIQLSQFSFRAESQQLELRAKRSVDDSTSSFPVYEYTACGGVVVDGDRVLVLRRPAKGEVRLPKGHLEDGESTEQAALREVVEETGFLHVEVVADLGGQLVEFDFRGRHWRRTERYFLMRLAAEERSGVGEPEFEPAWVTWEEALESLTYEAEKEWMRRARAIQNSPEV